MKFNGNNAVQTACEPATKVSSQNVAHFISMMEQQK